MSTLSDEHYLYHLPDEFCIFVSIPGRLNKGELDDLVGKLWGVLSQKYGDVDTARIPVSQLAAPADSKNTGLLLFTYRVGAEIVDDPDEAQTRRQRVQQIVEDLNKQQRDWIGVLPAGSVVAALPQLLTVAAQNGYTGGGPGSGPDQIDPLLTQDYEFGRFSFPKNDQLNDLVNAQRERGAKSSGVTVAILDAWPAANPAGGGGLLSKVAASLDSTELNDVMASGFTHQVKQRDLPYQPLPDHGLFITGIVSDIAPAATLRPIRVLDDFCIGTASELIAGLARLQAIEGPLVINLSLGFLPEDAVGLLTGEFPATSNLSAQPFAQATTAGTALSAPTINVQALLSLLVAALAMRKNTLIVASAGNDAEYSLARPLPEFPARYDWGLSVASINSLEQPSKFSNRSEDQNPPRNGIAVLGGDADTVTHTLDTMPGSTRKKEAIAGLYSAFPASATGAYKANWAYWAGTSFAAPIISGIAAAIWGANPTWPADKVKAEILSYGEGYINDLNCWYITAEQDIRDPSQPTA